MLPSVTTLVTQLPFYVAGAFLLAFLFRRGLLVVSVAAVVAVVAVLVGCYLKLHPSELPLSAALVVLRVAPFALGAIGGAGMGFAIKTLARRGGW